MHTAPDPDKIEVSVFGPSYGECILLHVGKNNWLIVDSCLDPDSREPVPLIYLRQIGVDPAQAVKQVVATHWHDDHIGGLGKVVEACTSAEFVCSNALQPGEFLILVEAVDTNAMMQRHRTGVKEFRTIYRALAERRERPQLAIRNRVLWQEGRCSVQALSPSDDSVILAYREIEARLREQTGTKKALVPPSPNHNAVVLWITVGDIFILLGADLEETREPGTGWSEVIRDRHSPSQRASLFKIPHHGSNNADNPRIWADMLEPNPFAALTPWTLGGTFLPKRQDIDRICLRTDRAYSTATHRQSGSRRRARGVERTIGEIGATLRPVPYSRGHVRFRTKSLSAPTEWQVDLFEGAVHLSQVYLPR